MSVDRSPGELCLPKRWRLNDIRTRIDGLDRAASGGRQPRERAGAPPLFGAFGDPGGDPGAGVAPARWSKCARLRAQNESSKSAECSARSARHSTNEEPVIVASLMGLSDRHGA